MVIFEFIKFLFSYQMMPYTVPLFVMLLYWIFFMFGVVGDSGADASADAAADAALDGVADAALDGFPRKKKKARLYSVPAL